MSGVSWWRGLWVGKEALNQFKPVGIKSEMADVGDVEKHLHYDIVSSNHDPHEPNSIPVHVHHHSPHPTGRFTKSKFTPRSRFDWSGNYLIEAFKLKCISRFGSAWSPLKFLMSAWLSKSEDGVKWEGKSILYPEWRCKYSTLPSFDKELHNQLL